ncbi:MAG: PhoX family phosphatase [Myxococcota bacterium]
MTPKDTTFDQPHQDELHDDMESIPTNPTSNTPFRKILADRMSRRKMMQGSLATAAASSFLSPDALASRGRRRRRDGNPGEVNFREVSIERGALDATTIKISEDYDYQPFIPWGTPIEPGATRAYNGEPTRRPTAEEAALQIGIGHDGMWFFPADERARRWRRFGYRLSNRKGMLCVNHEFGRNTHVMGKPAPTSLEDVRLSQHVHGVSVVAIELDDDGLWTTIASPNARRIHVNTPVTFSGPVAGSALLENTNGNVPLGTVNNCGSGPTLWGTYLTCEENFNGYFGYNDASYTPTTSQTRYGFSSTGFGYDWHSFDKRFDISDPEYANESNRFGWVVEIDPFDGTQTPVKRTALGRFKHEAIAMAEAPDGRIACYMGDDQRFDYCYKYVSDRAWEDHAADGESPLDHGTLYVARFNADGTGDWIALNMANPTLSTMFTGMDDLLVNTRLAADAVGATPMDRPEWTTIGKHGEVYWTLTNNSQRTTADAANPEAPNNDGHIIKTMGDHRATTFTWDIFIIASTTRGTPGVFTDPDAAWADDEGRLFIGTDGGQPDGLQDQLVVFDTSAEEPVAKRLLVGVASDEITGFTVTPNYRWAFTNVQHPGNGDPTATNFPEEFDGVTIPRDCTLVLRRKNGGRIGS